jgi:ABC-2 type transport system ATP-binding protein
MNDAIVLEDVTRRYGTSVAVDRLSLTVTAGEIFGLIGPDGAGKTTTVRLMAGLLRPDAGRVRVLGRDPVAEHRTVVQDIGYLSQRFTLYGDLTIDENVAFFAEIHGVTDYAAARDRLLDMTGLTPFRARLADRLSGGMKQKLALACTLVHEPKLLLLDEPTTGVDPVSRREFWMLLSEFLAQGMTIVMATPYLDEAERCRRVALLDRGRLLALDDPSRLRAAFTDEVIEVMASPHRDATRYLAEHLPGADVLGFGERTHVRLKGQSAEGTRRAIAAALEKGGFQVASVRAVEPSLEDVFIDRLRAAEASSSSVGGET